MGWILSTLLAQILIDFFVNIYEGDVSIVEVRCWIPLLSNILKFPNPKMRRWARPMGIKIKYSSGKDSTPQQLRSQFPNPNPNQDQPKCRKYIDFFIVTILAKYHLVPSALACLHWSSSPLSLKNPAKIHAMFSILFIFFSFSFRLTPEVCFILMGLSQKA